MARFINITTEEGLKYVNVEHIVAIEEINKKVIVTLSAVRGKENVHFVATLPWATITSNVLSAQLSTTPLQ